MVKKSVMAASLDLSKEMFTQGSRLMMYLMSHSPPLASMNCGKIHSILCFWNYGFCACWKTTRKWLVPGLCHFDACILDMFPFVEECHSSMFNIAFPKNNKMISYCLLTGFWVREKAGRLHLWDTVVMIDAYLLMIW